MKNSQSSICPIRLLEQNPALSTSLLVDCNYNLHEVTTLIEPVLRAPKRCQITSYYIQAVVTDRMKFLATNLTGEKEVEFTAIASTWLVGRSSACAIAVTHPSVSRRHAAVGYTDGKGFYLTDLGSSNGTRLNRRKIQSHERYSLEDGDLIRLGGLDIEFFISSRISESLSSELTLTPRQH